MHANSTPIAPLGLPARRALPTPTATKPSSARPTKPAPASPAPIILFGRDERGRPHASRFNDGDRTAIEATARRMAFHIAVADTGPLRELATKLQAGRLLASSGKAFVPFVLAALYDRLLAASGTPDASRPVKAAGKAAEGGGAAGAKPGGGSGGAGAGGPPPTRAGAKAPTDWSQIGLGSLVLAQDDDEDGYYAAKVVATKADDRLVLTWAHYPDLPEFQRARRALALLNPEIVEGVA